MRLSSIVIVFAVIIAVVSDYATTGETIVLRPYASEQENQELASVDAIAYDAIAAQKKLEDVLEVNPHNRPGRLMLAELLLYQGKVSQAKAAVNLLIQEKPVYSVMEFQLKLGKATNDKALQAFAYAALAAGKDMDYWAGPKAEFEGDLISAEKAYKNAAITNSEPLSFYAQYRLVEFLMRRGDIPRQSTRLNPSCSGPRRSATVGAAECTWIVLFPIGPQRK